MIYVDIPHGTVSQRNLMPKADVTICIIKVVILSTALEFSTRDKTVFDQRLNLEKRGIVFHQRFHPLLLA